MIKSWRVRRTQNCVQQARGHGPWVRLLREKIKIKLSSYNHIDSGGCLADSYQGLAPNTEMTEMTWQDRTRP